MTYRIVLAAVLLWVLPFTLRADPSLNVHVSILPQKYFVEKIGRDNVQVHVLVKPGKSPGTYSPTPQQIKDLASADLYFRIGVPFENGMLPKIQAIAGLKIVDTRQGIALRQMKLHTHGKNHADTHSHAHSNSRSLADDLDSMGKDPHVWMNPLMVKTQAKTISRALSTLDPSNKAEYESNYTRFAQELDTLDRHMKQSLKVLKGDNLFVFHPSFGYFTDAYGLKQIAIETMGKAPKGKTLSRIIKLARKEKVRVIFVQPQFDRNAAQKIAAAINGAVVSIDPLAYDYLANMKQIAQAITEALTP